VADVGVAVLVGDRVGPALDRRSSTSTVAPQERQTRWWWCVPEQRRQIASPSSLRSMSTSPASASAASVR
jgi:hypothetical protein